MEVFGKKIVGGGTRNISEMKPELIYSFQLGQEFNKSQRCTRDFPESLCPEPAGNQTSKLFNDVISLFVHSLIIMAIT